MVEEHSDASRRAAGVVLAAAGIPIVAEVVASAAGSGTGRGYGPVFQVGAVLGALVATWFATRRGLWWLVPAQPLIVVPAAVGGTVLNEPGGTRTAQVGTDAATALQHAFLISVAAVAAVVVVSVVKAALTGRSGQADRSGRTGAAPTVRTRHAGARRG